MHEHVYAYHENNITKWYTSCSSASAYQTPNNCCAAYIAASGRLTSALSVNANRLVFLCNSCRLNLLNNSNTFSNIIHVLKILVIKLDVFLYQESFTGSNILPFTLIRWSKYNEIIVTTQQWYL